jgi:hypothetical protein
MSTAAHEQNFSAAIAARIDSERHGLDPQLLLKGMSQEGHQTTQE